MPKRVVAKSSVGKTEVSKETAAGPAVPIKEGAKERSIYAPTDPGEGLSSAEQAVVLELKKRHPAMGPAQIRAQLKRFKG